MQDISSFGHPDPLHYGHWWDFNDQPIVHDVPFDPVTAHADADGDTGATLIGVVSRASRIIGGHLVVSINSAGIGADPDDSVFVITAAGTTVITKTNVADLVADTPVSLGTPTLVDVAAGSAIKLAITNGTNADLNSAICHVTLQMADAANFPAPGLTVVATNGGTCTIADGVKGVCALSPGSADNDEIYMAAELENVKLLAGKAFVVESLIQFTEANTDDANILGLAITNAVAANELVDNGGGPKATGDYIAIWKVDGGTKWYAGCQSNGTAIPATDTVSDVTAGGSAYQRLKIKVTCETATRAIAEFTVDGQNIGTIHFDYASATEMQLCVGAKNGDTNAETLNVDYFGYDVLR